MACFFFVIDDQVLSRFPILKRDALIKKYSKYSVPTNVEKHEKHVLPDHFEFSPDMLFRRSIAGHHMHRQEEAKAFGAPAPAHQRSGAFHKDKLVFETPTFQRRISVSELRPDDVKMVIACLKPVACSQASWIGRAKGKVPTSSPS
mmetsp:Transcript_37101/g.116734  ORF Transcript_37101/g.116734 Transcript_37101/m.116734 type:complete len:146 (+) Transcript_37101:860-1297(+)